MLPNKCVRHAESLYSANSVVAYCTQFVSPNFAFWKDLLVIFIGPAIERPKLEEITVTGQCYLTGLSILSEPRLSSAFNIGGLIFSCSLP